MSGIVVGVDESEGAARALRWAAREGELHGATVTAVMAWGLLDQHQPHAEPGFRPDYGEAEAAAALTVIATDALGHGLSDRVRTRVVCDLPVAALLDASVGADLLVVGARGRGGFKGLLLGSVSQQCLHHSTVAIAVVREEPVPTSRAARIVAAIDGSDTARQALAWALREARVRHAHLTVVNAWPSPLFGPPDEYERASVELIAAALDGVDTSGMAGPIERASVRGGAAGAILDTAEGADLVVMGSRGMGGFKGLILGSVTAQVAQHADATVVVVPADF